VELFAEIRREYQFGIGTIKGVARKLGVHRRVVRQALADAVPPPRGYVARAKPTLTPVQEFIDRILESDRLAPRKQRHTARRIYDRLCRERPEAPVAASTVRKYVGGWKRAQGLSGQVVCVPQTYGWGQEAQVDWYEAVAILGDEEVTLQVFCVRSMASGAAFHRAYPRATQQAFLEAHEGAFQYFGGVFATLRYDNLTSAVRKILRGFRREETTRFLAFRSHWQFDAEFCTPGEGHEKGGVEGEAGYFRRNHWVPLPEAADLDALNAQLLAGCRADEARVIHGRTQTVGEAVTIEHASLRPLATERFDLQEVSFPKVDGARCVRVKTNPYSVPAAIGTCVEAKLGSAHVELWAAGQCLARHERSYVRFEPVLELEHYPRRARAQARRVGGVHAVGAVSAAGPLAGELRRVVGALDRPTWQTRRDPPDDRRVAVGAHLRDGRSPAHRRGRAPVGLHGPRRDPPSAPHGDARAPAEGSDAD
jgi:transposase